MQEDYKDAQLLEECADTLNEVYQYISAINNVHKKRVKLVEKLVTLNADIKSAKKLLTRRK
jgi:hypothetical protein